jgi:hypothetical protein
MSAQSVCFSGASRHTAEATKQDLSEIIATVYQEAEHTNQVHTTAQHKTPNT